MSTPSPTDSTMLRYCASRSRTACLGPLALLQQASEQQRRDRQHGQEDLQGTAPLRRPARPRTARDDGPRAI